MNKIPYSYVAVPIYIVLTLLQQPAKSQGLNKADSALDEKDYTLAISLYTSLLESSTIVSPLDFGNAHMRKGICFFELNQHKNALEEYFISLKIFEKINDPERIAAVCANIAKVYSTLKDYNNTEKFRLRSLENFQNLNDSFYVAFVMNDLAVLYYQTNNIEKAITLHTNALEKYISAMNDFLIERHLYNKGNCYELISQDSCLKYYLKAEEIAIRAKDSSMLSVIYSSIGESYRQKGFLDSAVYFLNKSLTLNNKFGNQEEQAVIYKSLGEIHYASGRYRESYHAFAEERRLIDEIFDIEKSKFASELSEKYESDKKDEKIRTQEIENRLKSRNLLLSLGGLGLVATLALVILVNYKRKQKANKLLRAQNEHIENLNKELDISNQVKTKLFSVISHDLRSPISSLYAYLQLKSNASGQKDEALINQTEQLLETLEDLLIWSKSQLHQFVPLIERINVHDTCNNIIGLLHSTALQKDVQVINNTPRNINVNTDINILTIILRNVLANAIKFSLPSSQINIHAESKTQTKITVSNETSEENTNILYSVKNDRVTSSKSGLGLTLVKEFAEKLNGNFFYSVSHDRVTASIEIPST